MLYLGCIFYNNKLIPNNISKAIYYLTLASDHNNKIAQYLLGVIYYSGKEIKVDIDKAIYYFSLSANQNYAESQYNLGLIYLNGQYVKRDINKSIHYFTLASNQNHPKSMYCLGVIFYNNKFVSRDIDKSIHYFTLASKQNYENAHIMLGFLYYQNNYIKEDINKSIHFFTLASNNYNNPYAQTFLGFIYLYDINVKRDIKKSIHFFTLAANQNDPQALFYLGIIYYYRENDIKKAIHYFTLSSDRSNSEAQLFLGIIYLNGKYIEKDINKSIYYFNLAATKNNSDAQLFLGFLYYTNKLEDRKYIDSGIYWLTKSAKNKNIKACFIIGFIYHEGKNIKRDIKKCMDFYREASSFNNRHSKNNIGIIYKNGFGNEVSKNIAAAKLYFKEAIKQKNDYVSMYNLSNIYIFEKRTDKSIDKSINLLTLSFQKGFYPSLELLCFALIKKYGDGINKIDIQKQIENNDELVSLIFQTIQKLKLNDSENYEEAFQKYKEIDFLYNECKVPIQSKVILNIKLRLNESQNKNGINLYFYEGFGMDIYNPKNKQK